MSATTLVKCIEDVRKLGHSEVGIKTKSGVRHDQCETTIIGKHATDLVQVVDDVGLMFDVVRRKHDVIPFADLPQRTVGQDVGDVWNRRRIHPDLDGTTSKFLRRQMVGIVDEVTDDGR